MLPTDSTTSSDTENSSAPAGLAAARIGIGLAQGLLLYLLYTAAHDKLWPATAPLLFVPLVLGAVLLPLIAINSMGHMPRRQLLPWMAAAGSVLVLLGVYDAWRAPAQQAWRSAMPSGTLAFSLAAGFFIAHALVLAGSRERRRIASYASYFDVAWKLGLQIAFSLMFVGAAWLILHLGAALFSMIKLDFLRQALDKPWFSIPVTTFAFASAMHLTDIKPGIVRGIRNLAHVLLSWTLPVLTVLVAGFLASLPFTGLAPLWATRSAGALLISVCAALVVLINAGWQDGATPVARPIALATRVASLLLAPLTLLAAWAITLRVGQYGWTGDRVIGAACLLVAACYAGGYGAAALRRGWLATLAGVNIAAAMVVIGVLILLLSPLADPARIGVASQMARLDAGKITLRQLDLAYLYHNGAIYGRQALATLTARADKADAAWLNAELVALRPQSGTQDDPPSSLADNLRVWPAGASLPPGFAATDWHRATQAHRLLSCMRQRGAECDAFVVDLDGDAHPEVILVANKVYDNAVLRQNAKGAWEFIGSIDADSLCPDTLRAMREGRIRTLAQPLPDLEVDGQRVKVHTVAIRRGCHSRPQTGKPGPAAPAAGQGATEIR